MLLRQAWNTWKSHLPPAAVEKMESLRKSKEPGKQAKMDQLILQCIPRDVTYQTRVPPKFDFTVFQESQKRSDCRYREAGWVCRGGRAWGGVGGLGGAGVGQGGGGAGVGLEGLQWGGRRKRSSSSTISRSSIRSSSSSHVLEARTIGLSYTELMAKLNFNEDAFRAGTRVKVLLFFLCGLSQASWPVAGPPLLFLCGLSQAMWPVAGQPLFSLCGLSQAIWV